jgi:uncharacterized membrane protein
MEKSIEYLEQASSVISLFAMAVIVTGFLWAAARYANRFRRLDRARNFDRFKIELGRALLLGLEILVLADVIDTIVVRPTFPSLALLAFLVLLRTVVSWTLTLEVENRWPWQNEAETDA